MWDNDSRERPLKITIQYFDGCPHWELADARVRHVIEQAGKVDVQLEYQLIDSPEMAEQVGFHGSPTILVDGRDPFATGGEPIGLSCRVFQTEEGPTGAPTLAQLRRVIAPD